MHVKLPTMGLLFWFIQRAVDYHFLSKDGVVIKKKLNAEIGKRDNS